ncbi:hypothetical protein [Nocardia jejuensis]|uniref:hypothetical protein n=1 Tax=Nocardia jejuensis TaxID=328049 RepID=UPI00082AA1C7|nr:hypothetical protein [Nocardia jejuensis]
MKRSALLLLTTAGMILAGAGVTEMLGDATEATPSATLAQQRFVAQPVSGEILHSSCVLGPAPADR